MPNWAFTDVAIKGTKKEIRNLIALGLHNSGVKRVPTDTQKAFDLLLKEGKTKCSVAEGEYPDRKVTGVSLEKGVTMQTFFPMPDSYHLYDTTNYPDKAPKEVLEEQKKLGAVGWYDYGVRYFGTKWNTNLEDLRLEIDDKGSAVLHFYVETAWSLPDRFFERISAKFHDLVVIAKGTEESYAYFVVLQYEDGEESCLADYTSEFNYEDEDAQEEVCEKLNSAFAHAIADA